MTLFFIDTSYKSDERFDWGRLMEWTDNHDPLTSAFLNDLRALPHVGEYVVVGEAQRPDVLSYKIYRNYQYWWILLLYNGIMSSDDLVAPTVIKYPSRESLEDLYFGMKARKSAARRG